MDIVMMIYFTHLVKLKILREQFLLFVMKLFLPFSLLIFVVHYILKLVKLLVS